MLICALCGEPIDVGDAVIIVHQAQALRSLGGGLRLAERRMGDGSLQKICHLICPPEFGAPLAMLGADRRPDV